jgi:peptidoglycan hydrolase-like protein with peptidoglycan-binding domain
MANRDYKNLTATYGAVPTIAQALEPAKTQYLNHLREQFPDQADQLTDRAFMTGAITVANDAQGNPQLTLDQNRLALRQGDRGPDVKALQEELVAQGYAGDKKHPLKPDGDFGSGTALELIKFQKAHHLTPNGVDDVATQQALRPPAQTQQPDPFHPFGNTVHPFGSAALTQPTLGLPNLGQQNSFNPTQTWDTPIKGNDAAAPGMDPGLRDIFNAMQSGDSAQIDAAMELNAKTYLGSLEGQAFLQNVQTTAQGMFQAQQQAEQKPQEPQLEPAQTQGYSRTR